MFCDFVLKIWVLHLQSITSILSNYSEKISKYVNSENDRVSM